MNRSSRRKAKRELRKAIKSGVGVSARLAGYRVIRPDGTVRIAVGIEPGEREDGEAR